MNSTSGSAEIGIEVKLTDFCNQSCFHCVNSDGPNPDSPGRNIDHRLVIMRLRELAETPAGGRLIKEVRMTGGEPLLNLEAARAITECCRDLGISSGINTNGTLLDRKQAADLKERGLKILKVSMDSLNPQTLRLVRGSGASLEKTMEGIQNGIEAGFKVILRLTLSHFNRDELLDCYRFAAESGAHKFQVKPLIQAGRGKGCGGGLSSEELSRSIQSLAFEATGHQVRPEILCVPPARAHGLGAKACGSVNKIYLATDGKVLNCNFMSAPPYGDLGTQSLEEILAVRKLNTRYQMILGNRVLEGCPVYKDSKDQARSRAC